MISSKEISRYVNQMTIRKRSDGRLEGRLTIDKKSKSFYGKTVGDIKTKARDYLTKLVNGYIDSNISLKYYMEHWLKIHSAKVEESTSNFYVYEYDTYIRDSDIGKKKISVISTNDLQNFINNFARPSDNIKPLSYGTIKNIKILLQSSFSAATKDNVIATNPMLNVKMPKKTYVLKQTATKEILTEDEMKRFKEFCLMKNESKRVLKQEYKFKHGLHYLLLLNLGLRVGELLSLQWKDVNFDEKYVYINSTAQVKLRNEEYTGIQYKVKNSTKTPSGVRYLKLNDEVLWYFKEIKRIQEVNNEHSNFVCTDSYDTLRISLNYLIKKAGINKKITPHCLRHTFGSTLLQRDVNIEVVSKLMGHADIMTTYNTYIHVIEEQKTKTMQSILIC